MGTMMLSGVAGPEEDSTSPDRGSDSKSRHGPAIPLPVETQENRTHIPTKTVTPMFTAALFITAQKGE